MLVRSSILCTSRPKSRWIGRTELFGGRQDMQINQRDPEIRKPSFNPPIHSLHYRKWPGIVGDHVKSSYWFRDVKVPLSIYQIGEGDDRTLYVASADPYKIATPTIENALHDNTRGHSVQLLFEGRGVKAYLEPPQWPCLKVKMSVGAGPIDFTHTLKRDPEIRGFVDVKNGSRVVLHGPSKKRVGRMAMRIFRATKARPITGKGSHIAGNLPEKIKVAKKK